MKAFQPSITDQRSSSRIPTYVDCRISFGEMAAVGYILNVALSGALVGCNSEIPVGADVSVTIDIREPELCPRFTAREIRGATVKPSPANIVTQVRRRPRTPREPCLCACWNW